MSLVIVWQMFLYYILSWSHFELIIEPRNATAVGENTPRHKWFHTFIFILCFCFCFRFSSPLRISIPIPIKNLLSNLDLDLDWTLDAPRLNLGLGLARPRWPHWSCVTVSRGLNWFLKLNLAPLTSQHGRGREGAGGGGFNLNGCGNWGAVECFMRLPQAELASCCVLYLFVASFNLVFLIWIFTLLDSLRISASG